MNNKYLFIILVIIISILIIYIIITNINTQGNKSKIINELQSMNKLRDKITENKDKILLKNIKNSIYNFVVNRLSYENKLSSRDILKLKENFIFITDQILNELLNLYSIYEIDDIISNDPYDIYNNLLKSQFNNKELLYDQQIAGINFLKNKYPKIDLTIIFNYIKKYPNIFKIQKINVKNNKFQFSKDQHEILENFKL